MNPRAPQQPGTPQLQPDRPNPWGGPAAAPQTQQVPLPVQASAPAPAAPAPVSNTNAVHQLQCPKCGAGLTLRNEHLGINGSCIHCNAPIRGVAYQDGRVAIELIEAPAPAPQAAVPEAPQEIPVEVVEEVAVELQPTVPSSEAHQKAAEQAAPSIWQTQPTEQPSAQAFPQAQPAAQSAAAPAAAQQTHASPPPQENTPPAWDEPAPGSMFQTGSAPSQAPEQQAAPAGAPAFPSPNGAMPWTNSTPQPPVVEQDNFKSFQAASPFASPPHVIEAEKAEEAAKQAQAQSAAIPQPNAPSSSKRLGKSSRKRSYGFLKFVAALVILGGLGYGAFLFAPQDKVDQAKLWVGEFMKPAFEVFSGKTETDYSPENPAVPNQPVTPSGPATTIPTAPASSVAPPVPATPETPNVSSDKVNSTSPAKPIDPVSEQLRVNVAGTTAIREFYGAPSIESRLAFVTSPEKSRLPFDAYSGRFETLPTLKAVALQKAALDSGTGRWFGIFEVAEKENDKLHRWVVVENEKGEFKLDWRLYEQLVDNALPRFLDDPTVPPQEFRLAMQIGTPVLEDNNPWNSEPIELLIQTPFDSQTPRSIILKKTDFDTLGLGEKINQASARPLRVELGWVPSEYDPNSRVPTITKLVGFGLWESEPES